MDVREEARETLKLAVPITFAQVALMVMGLVDVALVGRVSDVHVAAVATGNSIAFAMLCSRDGRDHGGRASRVASRRCWRSRARLDELPRRSRRLPRSVSPDDRVDGRLHLHFGTARRRSRGHPARPPLRSREAPRHPGVLLFMASKAYLEARGITRPLFLGGWAGNVVNVVVCSLLVFGDRALIAVHLPGIGLPARASFGAGIATSIANWVLAGIALTAAWFARPEGATMTSGSRAELLITTRKLIRVGVPIGFQIFTEVGVFALVSLLVGRLGARTLAAHQIAIGLSSLTYMGVLGISSATAVRVGRAVGSQEPGGPRRAGVVGLGIVTIYMAFCALTFVIFPRPLARIFNADEGVIETAVTLLRVAAFFQIADGIQGCAGGALRGAADTKFASYANVVCHWMVGLPLAILFCFGMHRGAVGTWWGLSIGLFVVAAVLTLRFFRISSRTIHAV